MLNVNSFFANFLLQLDRLHSGSYDSLLSVFLRLYATIYGE